MSIAPVVIEFQARGMPNVARAFRSVEQTIAGATSRSARAVLGSGKQQEQAFQRLAKEAEKWQRQQVRSVEKAARDELRAADRAGKDKVRAEERTAKQIAAIRERSASMAGRFATKQAADEAREAARANARRASAMAIAGRRGDREAGAAREMYTSAMGRGTATTARLIGRGVSAAASTVAKLGGGFSIGDSVLDKVNLERQAAMLSNNAITPSGVRPGKAGILASVRRASIASGTDEADLMQGLSGYTAKSADFEGGQKNLEFFGQLAKVTGSSVADIGRTAGQLRVQNKGLDDGKMKQLLLDTVQQSRMGSVDPEELAKSAGRITRTSSSYAGNQTDNQRKLLGLSQVAMRTSGSVEEAATVLANVSQDASKHNDKVKAALGKDAFNDRGQIAKGPEEFLADVMDRSGGDLQKIQAMGFGARSMKMFQALAPTYEEGLAKDGKKGARKAILDDMKSMTGASYSEAQMKGDFGEQMKVDAEKFEGAMRSLKQVAGDQLLPELVKLVGPVRELVPIFGSVLRGLVKLATWVETNPFEGLALAIGGAITKEIIAAQIGATIKNMLGGGGGLGGGGLGGGTAAAGAGGGLLAGGLLSAGVGLTAAVGGQMADTAYGGYQKGNATIEKLVAGSPEERAAGMAKANSESGGGDWAQTAITGLANGSTLLNPFAAAGRLAGNYIGGKASDSGQSADLGQAENTIASQMVSSSDKLIAAMNANTASNNALAAVGGGAKADQNAPSRNAPMTQRGGAQ